jgi:hypothetical protein
MMGEIAPPSSFQFDARDPLQVLAFDRDPSDQ